MDKEIVVFIQNDVLLCHEEGYTGVICREMDAP